MTIMMISMSQLNPEEDKVMGVEVSSNHYTGKSFSEALILASTNPQYDNMFIDLPVQYMKTASSEHVVYKNCFECQNKNKITIYVHTQLVVFMC